MNPTNIFTNSQKIEQLSKKPEESDSFQPPLQLSQK